MKVIQQAWLIGAGLFVSFNLHAQTFSSAQSIQSIGEVQPDSIVCVTAESQGLTRMAPEDLPIVGGTYWWALPMGGIVPTPFPQDVSQPIYQIMPGVFLEDATGGQVMTRRLGSHGAMMSVTDALAAEAQAVVNLIGQVETPVVEPPAAPMMRMSSMMTSSLATTYAYGNLVYLAKLTNGFASDGSVNYGFSVFGGTNFVPWDIEMSTNLAAPNWTWQGIAYTSNSYVLYGQPSDQAFYRLASPTKTMTVGFGNDDVAQCDVPFGFTNALQVAGGAGHSLALKTDGTVVAWGWNNHGQATVPTNLTGVAMIAAGYYHSVALLTNGMIRTWGISDSLLFGGLYITNVPPNLTNVTVISAQAFHTLALTSNGMVVAWGYNTVWGETNVPAGLSNVVALSAGYGHNLAVKSDGTVVGWGFNGDGQCNVPIGLSNVVDVAAGLFHSLALKNDGTVVAWGADDDGEIDVPAGLSNVVAIAASGDTYYTGYYTAYSLALKKDGSVVAWGDDEASDPVGGLSNVVAIAAGADHALAVRTGPPTPVVTLEPVSHYQAVGSTITLAARGAGLYGVTYQWQTNAVNLPGATNTALILTNVQAASATNYSVIVTDNTGMGSITSSIANLYLITPPVITYQSTPTNIVCIYGNHVAFAATAYAPGQLNGFPLSYHWQLNGTNISGATSNAYDFYVTDASSGTYSFVAANAAGSASVSWQVVLTNAINVTNDLLLIYNTNSADSTFVKDYYLAHRPNVNGANVLGIGYTNAVSLGYDEAINQAGMTNQILTPISAWLSANPAKKPQYVILFLDVPTRVNDSTTFPTNSGYPNFGFHPSVSVQIRTFTPGWQPFVTHINMGMSSTVNRTNDCIGYINKLAYFGTNYSPGQLIISASAGGYGNTNYVVDNVRHGTGFGDNFTGFGSFVSPVTNALIASGVSSSSIIYNDGLDVVTSGVSYYAPQITNAADVAGYISWGFHSGLGSTYSVNGLVQWTGKSSWYILQTIESYNGQEYNVSGNYIQWFSANAFGGTNYSNAPIGAVSNVDEPNLSGNNDPAVYFESWATGKNFAICAWNSRNTPYFQAIGDPFVTK